MLLDGVVVDLLGEVVEFDHLLDGQLNVLTLVDTLSEPGSGRRAADNVGRGVNAAVELASLASSLVVVVIEVGEAFLRGCTLTFGCTSIDFGCGGGGHGGDAGGGKGEEGLGDLHLYVVC